MHSATKSEFERDENYLTKQAHAVDKKKSLNAIAIIETILWRILWRNLRRSKLVVLKYPNFSWNLQIFDGKFASAPLFS